MKSGPIDPLPRNIKKVGEEFALNITKINTFLIL